MSLREKLGRLGPRSTEPRQAPADPERGERIDGLRARMAEILGRPPAEPRPRRHTEQPFIDLPFSPHETGAGRVHRRFEPLSPSHHVGRMPVDAAGGAAAEILALLALDPALASVDPRRALFVDVESTGLAGSGTIAFLIGLAHFDSAGALWIEQLLLAHPGEEPGQLAVLRERIEAAGLIVSFNGKTFDLPLLATRFVMNRLPEPPARPHLDLLHVARRLHKNRIGRCTLKLVESEVLGFVRDSDISGAEVAPRWSHFLRTGDESVLGPVIDHNAWDVTSMAALVGLYGEPLEALHKEDLVGLADTFRRARALDRADDAASRALERGAGPRARRVRGEIAKARGDRARALVEFEALAEEIDDPDVRLELAKLYEHHAKDPLKALEIVERGTGETDDAGERRAARLRKKAQRGR